MTRVLVTGATGLLGSELVNALRAAGDDPIGIGRAEIDLERPTTMAPIADARPDLIVNAAAWTDVDGCALDPDRAMRINADGAGRIAAEAARIGARVMQISTNEVFPGEPGRQYDEDDVPSPINPYGASKLAGERAVAAAADAYLIIRTAWVFGPTAGFPARITAAAHRARATGAALRVVDDEWGNPTPVTQLARAITLLIARQHSGNLPHVLHLAGEPPTTRWAWAAQVLAHMDGPPPMSRISQADYQRPSNVPPHAVLNMRLSRDLGLPPIRCTTS